MNISIINRFGRAIARLGVLIFVILLAFNNLSVAQPMLNFPESVAWDPTTRTYLVSSALTGAIVRRSASGTLTPFASAGLVSSKGIVVAKFGTVDALWVADTKTLKAFNLATGAELGAFVVPDSFEINDVAADSTAGIFYISDPAVGIFRASVSVSAGGTGQATFAQIVPPDGINSPNGISFDRARNRLVVVSFAPGTSRIHGVNLRTTPPTVETLATTPSGSGSLDGIARDKQGRYYVSSWDANTITRYDSNFTSPTVIASGLETPADIFFNAATDTLVVPNFNRNTLDFIRIPPPATTSIRTLDASAFALTLAPNPTNSECTLSYALPKAAKVSITVINTLGQTLATWTMGDQAAGEYQRSLSFGTFPAGVYYCRIQADIDVAMTRINILR